MKRVSGTPRRGHSAPAFLLSLLIPACLAHGEGEPLSWVNALRRAAGAPSVAEDALLSETAHRWAARLAEAGVLSHRGEDGSSALDRYRALGGTEVHVGEILGAGAGLSEIEGAWVTSDEHRKLATSAAWTHVGWGSSTAQANAPGTAQVWVMVFCEKIVEDLRIDKQADGLRIAGRFVTMAAARAFLYSGLDPVEPAEWDGITRRFRFDIPSSMLAGYLRLGYLLSGGSFRLTNTVTLPRETEPPGARDRSEAPPASP